MSASLFRVPLAGTCLYCGSEAEEVVSPSGNLAGQLSLGVCDVCAYALRHFWKATRGEQQQVSSARLSTTYVLVPSLPRGRAPEDLSAYSFLVDAEGGLPWLQHVRDPLAAVSFLEREYGVSTFSETMRPCYLGYDGKMDFSEVVLAWAWGKVPGSRGQKFATFGELLQSKTVDAGFHLGVKQAFEGLLARRELSPESHEVCVVLREPAMRYMSFMNYASGRDPGEGHEDDDKDMIELCKASLTSNELSVLALLEGGARERAEVAAQVSPADVAPRVRAKIAPVEDAGDDEEVAEDASEGNVPEGFARPPRPLAGVEP